MMGHNIQLCGLIHDFSILQLFRKLTKDVRGYLQKVYR